MNVLLAVAAIASLLASIGFYYLPIKLKTAAKALEPLRMETSYCQCW